MISAVRAKRGWPKMSTLHFVGDFAPDGREISDAEVSPSEQDVREPPTPEVMEEVLARHGWVLGDEIVASCRERLAARCRQNGQH
jgi:hypothetical protein